MEITGDMYIVFHEKEQLNEIEKMIISCFQQIVDDMENNKREFAAINSKIAEVQALDYYFACDLMAHLRDVISDTIITQIQLMMSVVDRWYLNLEHAHTISECENQELIDFFKSEIPDVYKKLRREYLKSKKERI